MVPQIVAKLSYIYKPTLSPAMNKISLSILEDLGYSLMTTPTYLFVQILVVVWIIVAPAYIVYWTRKNKQEPSVRWAYWFHHVALKINVIFPNIQIEVFFQIRSILSVWGQPNTFVDGIILTGVKNTSSNLTGNSSIILGDLWGKFPVSLIIDSTTRLSVTF